jgi:hypothetical protein
MRAGALAVKLGGAPLHPPFTTKPNFVLAGALGRSSGSGNLMRPIVAVWLIVAAPSGYFGRDSQQRAAFSGLPDRDKLNR